MAHLQNFEPLDLMDIPGLSSYVSNLFEELSASKLPQLERLSSRLLNLYIKKINTDCVLKVVDAQFPAHKVILSAHSSVFAAMFGHDTDVKHNEVVVIQDVEPVILDNFLKYIYSGKIYGLDTETAVSMYELANKYATFDLRDCCLHFLKNNITIENVCDVAVLAHTHEETELSEKVAQFIENRREDIQQSNVWKNFAISKPSLAKKFFGSFVAS